MLNRTVLIGRLTKDPELRYTPVNQVPVAHFTIAVDRPYLNQNGERDADFIRIVAWRKLAEICSNNLTKGRLVSIDGRLQIRPYEGQDGQRRYLTEVVAEKVVFLDKAKDKNTAENTGDTEAPEPAEDPFDIDFSLPNFDAPADGVPF